MASPHRRATRSASTSTIARSARARRSRGPPFRMSSRSPAMLALSSLRARRGGHALRCGGHRARRKAQACAQVDAGRVSRDSPTLRFTRAATCRGSRRRRAARRLRRLPPRPIAPPRLRSCTASTGDRSSTCPSTTRGSTAPASRGGGSGCRRRSAACAACTRRRVAASASTFESCCTTCAAWRATPIRARTSALSRDEQGRLSGARFAARRCRVG